jgi:hypothetical protein
MSSESVAVRSDAAPSVQTRALLDRYASICEPMSVKKDMLLAAHAIRVALVGLDHIDQSASCGLWHCTDSAFDLAVYAPDYSLFNSVPLDSRSSVDDTELPFLTSSWLESIQDALSLCASTLDWRTATACVVMLVSCRQTLLSLPFAGRAAALLRANPTLSVLPDGACTTNSAQMTAYERSLIGCRLQFGVFYRRQSIVGGVTVAEKLCSSGCYEQWRRKLGTGSRGARAVALVGGEKKAQICACCVQKHKAWMKSVAAGGGVVPHSPAQLTGPS